MDFSDVETGIVNVELNKLDESKYALNVSDTGTPFPDRCRYTFQ